MPALAGNRTFPPSHHTCVVELDHRSALVLIAPGQDTCLAGGSLAREGHDQGCSLVVPSHVVDPDGLVAAGEYCPVQEVEELAVEHLVLQHFVRSCA